MNLGIIISRIGGFDEVSLETEKWIEIFEKQGHKVFIISGQFERRKIDSSREVRILEMSFFSPESYWEQKKAFFHPDFNQEDLFEHFHLYSKIIENKIEDFIQKFKLDILISENASSLPSHLSLALAIYNSVKSTNIPIICHNHSFAWERGDRYVSPHPKINEFIKDTFPMRLPNCYHVITCSEHQSELKKRYKIESQIIPYVMDFESQTIPSFNKNIYSALNLNFDDIIIGQVSRIVKHKGIENAVKLIKKLNDPKIKLLITGSYADDSGNNYYMDLVDLISNLGVSKNIIFGYDFFGNTFNKGVHSFDILDAYQISRASVIFSQKEGFINNIVESSYMKKPLIINSYNNTFHTDIINKGFEFIVTQNNEFNVDTINSILEIIYLNNQKRLNEIVENNYNIGLKYFSYSVLEENLELAINNALKM